MWVDGRGWDSVSFSFFRCYIWMYPARQHGKLGCIFLPLLAISLSVPRLDTTDPGVLDQFTDYKHEKVFWYLGYERRGKRVDVLRFLISLRSFTNCKNMFPKNVFLASLWRTNLFLTQYMFIFVSNTVADSFPSLKLYWTCCESQYSLKKKSVSPNSHEMF